jgi:hypothetical protein
VIDIVERLRPKTTDVVYYDGHGSKFVGVNPDMLTEAADEIERLRKFLHSIAYGPAPNNTGAALQFCRDAAKAALEGK